MFSSIFLSFCLLTVPEEDQTQLDFFEARIRPVLIRECYACHSQAAGKAEGSLLLDTRDSTRRGGDRGPAVVPNEPDRSWLLIALRHSDADLRMPPRKSRLSSDVIQDFETWIKAGAVDPRTSEASASTGGLSLAGSQHWAYQPPVKGALPPEPSAAWPVTPIDRFLYHEMNQHGITPASDASPEVMVRRLSFDLTGLPPSRELIQQFQKDTDEGGGSHAIQNATNALLSTPQYGERWGRHWLDVARYAESSGKEANISFPYAWRYRDYVIDCFNSDVPFDQFVIEQMAGDLLAAESDQERARLLIATGFLAIGTKNLDEASELQFQADVVDEQIDSVSRAFLAGTIACARCHDHKSDPFSMQDYYALAGIFSSSKTWFGTAVSPANRVGGDPLVLPAGPWAPVLHTGTSAAAVEKMQQELAALTEEKKTRTDAVLKAIAEGRNPEGEFSIRDALRIFWRSGALEGELEKVDSSGQPLTLAMGLTDQPAPADAPLLQRGDVLKPDQPIARDVPAVFRRHLPADANRKNTVLEIPEGQSGRFQLAQWIASPANPLTARVFVNRVWAHLMGRGLVPSVDHFGPGGQSSDHQALLDYLAVDFMEHGWSVKYLIRQIVSSRAYRQSSAWQSTAFSADPDNRWFGRMPSRRLEAEAIRDALLCASGEMQSERPVGSLVATLVGDRPVALIGLDPRIPADLDGSLHRSVYLPIMRNRLPEVLDVFDFPEPSGVIGTREVTNVPTQALYLMNSPFVQKRGEGLAARVRSMSEDAREQVQLMFELCFARRPSEGESERVIAFLQRSDAEGDLLTTVAVSLFCTAEFRTLD